ncbi:chloramphenicol-sensitive protein RarD [Pseudonocardia eucalypti]|uniref:EamA family transporter RarD n=1 Tax=Pseudonocardia eucalypti TaxID=648755 RepID=UPI0017BD7977|nr:chloramphenicol-sensitive protein RarD [Pseudonocardia eucalypti]
MASSSRTDLQPVTRSAGGVDARGVGLGAAAYAMWGLFPAFWALMAPAGPWEILAHRIAWTMILMAGVLALLRGWPQVRRLSARGWLVVTASALAIAVNWGVFIYGVQINHVVEVALGYYMNPLVSVLLGLLVLRERLRAGQWVALGLAFVAVVVLTVQNGRVPWLGLALATSFGVYGLLKKTVPLPSTASLTAEGLVLGPVAFGYLAWLGTAGHSTFGEGAWHTALLIAGGPVTAVPLLLFGAAARRIPLATLGTLMYLTPTMQFLWGWLVNHEPVPALKWAGFALVWTALVIFTIDLWLGRARATPPPQV